MGVEFMGAEFIGARDGASGVLSKEKSAESCFAPDELEMLSCEFVTVV